MRCNSSGTYIHLFLPTSISFIGELDALYFSNCLLIFTSTLLSINSNLVFGGISYSFFIEATSMITCFKSFIVLYHILTGIKISQVIVDSSIASPRQFLPIGTCILVEGVLMEPSERGKQVIELKVEKILHIGTVEHEKYPLAKKKLPFEMLRDYSQFRSRTTTVS